MSTAYSVIVSPDDWNAERGRYRKIRLSSGIDDVEVFDNEPSVANAAHFLKLDIDLVRDSFKMSHPNVITSRY